MQSTTLLGLIIGIGGILLGNFIEGGHVGSLAQGAAAVIVFLGTLGAVVVSSRKSDLKLAWKIFKKTVSTNTDKKGEKTLGEIIDCARLARKETILSIEPKLASLSDPFLQNVLRSVIDNTDPKVIKDVFEKQNNGNVLGNIAQSMIKFSDHYFISVNE